MSAAHLPVVLGPGTQLSGQESRRSAEPAAGGVMKPFGPGTGTGQIIFRKGSKAADVSVDADSNLSERLLELSRMASARL